MTTWLLSPFLHAGALHLVGNLLALAIVGLPVWRVLGWWKAGALFLVSGVIANNSAAALLDRPVIGASGAVAGVMAAHLVLCPRSRLALLIVLWIGLQVVFASVSIDFGGVAWLAHLVGASLGVVFALVFRSTRRRAALA